MAIQKIMCACRLRSLTATTTPCALLLAKETRCDSRHWRCDASPSCLRESTAALLLQRAAARPQVSPTRQAGSQAWRPAIHHAADKTAMHWPVIEQPSLHTPQTQTEVSHGDRMLLPTWLPAASAASAAAMRCTTSPSSPPPRRLPVRLGRILEVSSHIASWLICGTAQHSTAQQGVLQAWPMRAQHSTSGGASAAVANQGGVMRSRLHKMDR
ncbi:hypothetical protein COO60DRAFT_651790 [Scenedesmus sp. NREL 46B-D3]|nr:hypothetical protein COO60DRAFT_651790 [Scenedesmus sp. NREL 46B-D3]